MMMPLRHLLQITISALLIFSLTACGTTRKALNLETSAEFKFVASMDVNPTTATGKAAPIVVQVITLRDARQFKQEDFLNLFEDPQSRLGNDLIEITRLKEFAPGESRVETFNLTPDVKFIGILGEYIQYEDAEAKAIIPIEPHTTNKARISIEKLKVRIED
ncbi:type VI secretion system lipoprotein TssJ [Ketobacter alkanivorans]|uniref:Type VI secretion system-associated lipoprotein n=1 Tax=Ketobacter alkanivorans TaxID=1917421 RepID=A0A2K9LLM4_9GAMM|nr:type VI secretion system lipoprotein TssJ [Ketobacter alkanivorans]AUM13127.1 type VI secretion system-associated lipoprotein [Ketobacter alkanivorans]